MIRLTLFIVLLWSSVQYAAEPHYRAAKVLRVLDGDTCEVSIVLASKAELGSEFTITTIARLYGINAPDTKPDGKAKTKAATDNLRKLIADYLKDGAFEAELKGRDKYGRCLIILWTQGISLNQRMIDGGFAVVYLP